MKKCDDEEYLISDIADIATSNNNDDEQPEVVMANDIEIEEKLEEIENLRMFTGITNTTITIILSLTLLSENYRTSFVGHIIMMEAEMRSKDNDRKKLNNDNSELMKKLEELTQVTLSSSSSFLSSLFLLLDYSNENRSRSKINVAIE